MNPIPYRALVVEDDRSWRQILAEILTDHDFQVDTADSLEDAIRHLKSNPHRLAVVDLSLSQKGHSNKDGLQVLQAARLIDPNCKNILLTGFATVELAVAALTEYNAFTFLRKESFNRGQFRDIINKVLASAPNQSLNLNLPVEGTQTSAGSLLPDRNRSSSDDKALVVEDDAGWRSILEELLVDMGFQVKVCVSFGEALGYLRREKFSLAIVDMSLNGSISNYWSQNTTSQNLEGYQLLTMTRASGVVTIVVSGVASPEDIQKAYSEQSIFAYIEKQAFDRNGFRQIVQESRSFKHEESELSTLTEREREVFNLVAQGLTNKDIAEKLVITTNTVKRHLKAIFEKLNVHTRSAAASKAAGEKG